MDIKGRTWISSFDSFQPPTFPTLLGGIVRNGLVFAEPHAIVEGSIGTALLEDVVELSFAQADYFVATGGFQFDSWANFEPMVPLGIQ